MPDQNQNTKVTAEEIAELNKSYETSMLECYRIEAELHKYGFPTPKVKRPAKVTTGHATEEVVAEVKKRMAAYPKGAKSGEFTIILGRCGIVGVKQTGDARAELVEKGIITVEEVGSGSGRGNPKLIKLVQANVEG